ncbi:MAG TPA: MATE family efflux transporter [Verrucomicrobiae bacterium]|nr:MATE family efflux transporter [Verrucomicrobiae bacterium]
MKADAATDQAASSDLKDIWRLAIPAMLAIASEPVFVLADTAMIGRLGVEPLAARAIASSLIGGIYWIFAFLIFGTTTLVGFHRGRNEPEACGEICVHALFLALAGGAAVALLGYLFAPRLYLWMGAGPRVLEQGVSYFRIVIVGTPFTFLFFAAIGFLRGVEDTRTPMLIAFAANGLNIILDYIFIYGGAGVPPLGLTGAATARLVSQTIAGSICVGVVFFSSYTAAYRLDRWHFDTRRFLSLSRIGGDLALRTGALRFSLVFATGTVARMGAVALSSHEIALQLFLLSSDTTDGIAVAGQTLAAGHLGAGRAERALAMGKALILCGAATGVVFATAYFFFHWPLIFFFTRSPEVETMLAGIIFFLLAAFQPVNGAVFASDGFLLGVNDTRYLMRAMLIGALGIFVPVTWLSLHQGWGLLGVWIGLSMLMAWRLATNLARFQSKRWARLFPGQSPR